MFNPYFLIVDSSSEIYVGIKSQSKNNHHFFKNKGENYNLIKFSIASNICGELDEVSTLKRVATSSGCSKVFF